MEIEGEDGTKLSLNPRVKTTFGRGEGFNTDDLTVSRHHVSLELKPSTVETEQSDSDKVFFEVLGRNPVWVRTGHKIQTFRKPETGEISTGDEFCVSGNHPIWFNLKRGHDEVMEERVSDGEIGLDSIDFEDVDPVKEFGFLVIGKEFDQYSKSRMRDVKQWEWFLEDFTNGNSDDEDDDDGGKKGRKGLGKKRGRKKGNEEDDDDWGVESEEDKEMIAKTKGVKSANYSTRSKKSKKDVNASSSNGQTQSKQRGRVDVEEEDEEDEDEDDETLGGFIVTDEEEDELDLDDDEEEVVSDDDEDED